MNIRSAITLSKNTWSAADDIDAEVFDAWYQACLDNNEQVIGESPPNLYYTVDHTLSPAEQKIQRLVTEFGARARKEGRSRQEVFSEAVELLENMLTATRETK